MWSPLASASLVFLLLYLCLFTVLSTLFFQRKVVWKSRWLVLLLHVLVRLASQACGLSFGIIGYRNIDLLVAYYVLGAEGYFTLVVCTSRFLIAWQRNHWGFSWLEPTDPAQERAGWRKRCQRLFRWRSSSNDGRPSSNKWMVLVDWLLVGANAIIISGGSLSSAAYTDSDLTPSQVESRLHAARGMRAAGQAVFLAINTALLVCIAVTMHQHRRHRFDTTAPRNSESVNPIKEKDRQEPLDTDSSPQTRRPWFAHPILLMLLIAWPFLIVRGIFGVLQAVIPDLNYFNSEVYDANGLTQQFVTEETCMVTMMEFISATILTSTYFASRSEPHRRTNYSNTA
ncbi:hypothetical protein EX895_002068 [Sporisorium graminicola]|uniref:Uncharacterized protein n=1 Tax=Sporisorium graminicola TaxID=280036 RepID=A0A4U7KX76_9BASI|nr:hypothetical protein EX895_002068 [Sporisorium graminicola]TKY88827.1 hypothetical protein EX895_002068 [Sporisorium graminicola]